MMGKRNHNLEASERLDGPQGTLKERRIWGCLWAALVLLLSASSTLEAQNPGYIGRHVFVQGGISLPTFYPMVHDVAFPVQYSATAEATISTKWSLGLDYKRLPGESIIGVGGRVQLYEVGSYSYVWGHQLAFQARKWSFRAHGSIAPLGRYVGFRAGVLRLYARTTFPILLSPQPSPEAETEVQLWQPFIGLYTGRQWVLADWVTLDVHVSAHLTSGLLDEWYENFLGPGESNDELSPEASRYTSRTQMLRVHVKLGGLLPI